MDELLEQSYRRIRQAAALPADAPVPAVATPDKLAAARAALPRLGDADYLVGRGAQATAEHLLGTITPALNGQNRSSRYWGFVTGGLLPIGELADNLVSAFDQNVQVHLPHQTIATEVEDAALRMLIDLLSLGDAASWEGRTFTTGATASNILGLGCGREGVISARLPEGSNDGVGELGIIGACARAGVKEIQVLTSMGHSSLSKAASIVGLGRASVKEVPYSAAEPWRLNLEVVEKELQRDGVASIIALSAGEVNTGRFAVNGKEDMVKLRALADKYKAWIHVDGAFGIFARALPKTKDFARLHEYAGGLELADSITVDGHKLLNVPYDNGIFFTRKASILTSVCKNPNAAYLASGPVSDIQSPLNIGLENSRRFRALPAYAVLLSEGRDGLAEMLARMVYLARKIAVVISESEDYVLLPSAGGADLDNTHMVVLFRAKEDSVNEVFSQIINKSGEFFLSGTKWDGKPACRLAVASWRVNVDEDLAAIQAHLSAVIRDHVAGGQ